MVGHQYLQLGKEGQETAGKPHKWVTSSSDSKWTHNRLHQFSSVGDGGQDWDGVPLRKHWYRGWVLERSRGVEVFKAGTNGDTGGCRWFKLPTNSEQFTLISDHTTHWETDGSLEQRGVEFTIVWLWVCGEEQEEVSFYPSALLNLPLSPCSFYWSFFFFADGRYFKVHFNLCIDVHNPLPESEGHYDAV